MTKIIYPSNLKVTADFKKNIKLVINKLENREELDLKYLNHKLKDNNYYKDCYECHIER